MTVWDSLRMMRRRWWIMLLGSLLTLGLSTAIALRPVTYFAKVQVTILAPELGMGYNAFTIASYPLIGVAGAVAEVVGSPQNGATQIPGTSDLPGVGIQDGFSVRLPNIGGQWSVGYDGPFLDVQAVGRSPEAVLSHIDSAIGQIEATLQRWQAEAGVAPENFLRIQRSPAVTVVEGSRGSPVRALSAVVLLGMGVTVTVASTVDRRSAARSVGDARRANRG